MAANAITKEEFAKSLKENGNLRLVREKLLDTHIEALKEIQESSCTELPAEVEYSQCLQAGTSKVKVTTTITIEDYDQ